MTKNGMDQYYSGIRADAINKYSRWLENNKTH